METHYKEKESGYCCVQFTDGIEMNCISNIKQLMKNLNFTAEQAMSAIGLSEKDQKYYMSVINKENLHIAMNLKLPIGYSC